ncbi:hypothetical protein GCM10027589_06910 [Actinocorallia lasiicapitis]
MAAVEHLSYDLPKKKGEYLPDPDQPVDRWLQAANASNANTVKATIENIVGSGQDVAFIVDPFSGGGSVAMAARNMGVPFYGLEIDPVLACATLAKLTIGKDEIPALSRECLDVVAEARRHLAAAGSGKELSEAEIEKDRRAIRPVTPSRILCADATDVDAWSALALPRQGHAVIYTSPPFGVSSPRFALPASLHDRAGDVLRRGGVMIDCEPPAVFPNYIDIAKLTLKLVIPFLASVTLIVEHENDDQQHDSRDELAEVFGELGRKFNRRVTGRKVLETQPFSGRGMFSLVTCTIEGPQSESTPR